MKNNVLRAVCAIFAALFLCIMISGTLTVFAEGDGGDPAPEQTEESGGTGSKAIAAAIAVGLAAAAGAIGMGLAISKSTESMARQPEMAGKINSALMLGLVFIETAIIYALIVAILVIFVL